ncbi:hypothetical protein Q9295_10075 [Xinfangfangia sp. CPCC 101601]|uniref:DUF1488 family protein n=1 Tax=Pseudogemmobacter lacusdianii TaxID=3069608 RepID=A0ABU0VY90_9RHOB|nr:hypothetical protein [Xinfangfangia sp. CPCC 101601]MDQ2066724.1 hypothetical protein [Xinfangfangia sp. CPCC 101601]
MADIKLNFNWDINEDGEVEITLSPSKDSGVVLGTFTLDDDLFIQGLQTDINAFTTEGAGEEVFYAYEDLADNLTDIAETITKMIEEAKKGREVARFKVYHNKRRA